MKDFVLYAGEDFAIAGTAEFSDEDTSRTIEDYDIFAELSTTHAGERITATTSGEADILIKTRVDGIFVINVPSALSQKLSCGRLRVGLVLTHKKTGIETLSEIESVMVSGNRILNSKKRSL